MSVTLCYTTLHHVTAASITSFPHLPRIYPIHWAMRGHGGTTPVTCWGPSWSSERRTPWRSGSRKAAPTGTTWRRSMTWGIHGIRSAIWSESRWCGGWGSTQWSLIGHYWNRIFHSKPHFYLICTVPRGLWTECDAFTLPACTRASSRLPGTTFLSMARKSYINNIKQ